MVYVLLCLLYHLVVGQFDSFKFGFSKCNFAANVLRKQLGDQLQHTPFAFFIDGHSTVTGQIVYNIPPKVVHQLQCGGNNIRAGAVSAGIVCICRLLLAG